MEASEVPLYSECVGDEGDGVGCGDYEHEREARLPRIAACRGLLALA